MDWPMFAIWAIIVIGALMVFFFAWLIFKTFSRREGIDEIINKGVEEAGEKSGACFYSEK